MEQDREDELSARQDGRVYPLGRALRSSYDADNHATLGTDVAGLMIDLAKLPYELQPPMAAAPPPNTSGRTVDLRVPPSSSASWLATIGRLVTRRHS